MPIRLQPINCSRMSFKNSHKIALIRLLSEVVKADGEVNQNEIFYLEYIDQLFQINATDRKNAVSLTLEEAVRRLKQLSLPERYGVLRMVQQLSLSDNDLSTEESLLLTALSLSLNLHHPKLPNARILTINRFTGNVEGNVLFIEAEWNESCNRQIRSEYDAIQTLLHQEGYEFFYLPEIIRELRKRQDSFGNTLRYLHPELTGVQLTEIGDNIKQLTTSSFTREMFLNQLNHQELGMDTPAFFFQLPDLHGAQEVNFLLLNIAPDDSPFNLLCSFFDFRQNIDLCLPALFPIVHERSLMRYERSHARQMNREHDFQCYTGFHKIILDTLVKYHADQDNGLLEIDERGKFILHTPNPLEVKIPALAKSLYLFFLNYPEGIRLDDLKKHREEILSIYKYISTYKNEAQLRQAVWALTDYTGNTLSSAISRIKKAFCDLLGKEAGIYHITGAKGEPKRIYLDRSKVKNQLPPHLTTPGISRL